MKKFKRFIASVLAYLFIASLVPVDFLQKVANAAEEEYNVSYKSDYYSKAEEQYNGEISDSDSKDVPEGYITDDSIVREIISRISDELNLNINVDELEIESNHAWFFTFNTYNYKDKALGISVRRLADNGGVTSLEFTYGTAGYDEVNELYSINRELEIEGLIYQDVMYLTEGSMNANYDKGTDTLFIYKMLESNDEITRYEVSEIKGKEIINSNILESPYSILFYESFKQNDKLYINTIYSLLEYRLENGVYKFNEKNPMAGNNEENNQSEDVNIIEDVVVQPNESGEVVVEIPTIEQNKKNEVVVKTEEAARNIEVVIKDMEALKSGQGSLNAVLNNVDITLPFSVIDKTLIGENDTVTLKLDILSDSEITKDLKAVNKVFDFNLFVNKENEAIKIHNFKEGQAEITITLAEEEFQGLNKDKLKVYYYNEETKKFEVMETSVNGNAVTFKTPHFSKFVIAEEMESNTSVKPDTNTKEQEGKTDRETNNNTNKEAKDTNNNKDDKAEDSKAKLPNTGAVISNAIILVVALAVVSAGSVMLFKKRKRA